MGGAKAVLIVILASVVYLAVALVTIDLAFGAMPSLEWTQNTFGKLAGTRIWSQSAHASGVLLAAIPTAALLRMANRTRAVRLAAWTGVLTSTAALVPSFLHPGVRPYIDTSFYVIAGIDSLKIILILLLVTWILTRAPIGGAMQRTSGSIK